MTDLIIAVLLGALAAFPIAVVLGVIYFAVAVMVVNAFRLNYVERPLGFHVLNLAVLLTIISYFVVFAVAVRSF